MVRCIIMKIYRPLSFRKVKTCPVKKRRSKVSFAACARPYKKGSTLGDFLDSLPDILAARDFRSVTEAIVKARRSGRPVILGMGAHPIKAGLSPLIIDLMQRGVVTALATNGACIVHDFELSYAGHTSEDVEKELQKGMFGMAHETGKYLNKAIRDAAARGNGIGKSIGKLIHESTYALREQSIFARAYALKIPATVHVAVGTDIIHMHPSVDGASLGKGTLYDFRLFSSVVADLDGGVYLNLGSAVIMPEIFLKALTVARNLGYKVENITTVNMDFLQHYRPTHNVLRRPTVRQGASYALTGHHEIMLPLLAAAVIEAID